MKKILYFLLLIVASFSLMYFLANYLDKEKQPDSNTDLEDQTIFQEEDQTTINSTDDRAPVKMLFVGDIMLGRYVETLINKNGYNYPFSKITNLFDDDQYIVGNLEGPIVAGSEQTANYAMRFAFKPWVAQVLKDHNFDAVTLANNHTVDQGSNGYLETVQTLNNYDIQTFGHSDKIASDYVYIKTIEGQTFVFIGLNQVSANFDLDQAKQLVNSYKDKGIVIINIHWGNEYALKSNSIQQEIAHKLIDNGGSIIIGHHPHVTQEIGVYNNKPIFYSLGNFIFDQYFSEETQRGLALKFNFTKEAWEIEILPIKSNVSRPYLIEDDEKEQFLLDIAKQSSENMRDQITQGKLTLPTPSS